MNEDEATRKKLDDELCRCFALNQAGKCISCEKVVKGPDGKITEVFKDENSAKEFEDTGYCQACQDKFLGKDK